MIRLLGMLMVVVSATGIGYSFGNDCKMRISQLRQLKQILLLLRSEIKYAKTPLPEAFLSISSRTQLPFNAFLEKLSKNMKEFTGDELPLIWKENVKKELYMLKFTKEDRENLENFGNNLGYMDKDMQIRNIDVYIEQIDMEINTSLTKIEGKIKVYGCLGVMTGLLSVIILF